MAYAYVTEFDSGDDRSTINFDAGVSCIFEEGKPDAPHGRSFTQALSVRLSPPGGRRQVRRAFRAMRPWSCAASYGCGTRRRT